MKDKEKNFEITTVELGKKEILFVPLLQNGIFNSLGFFKRKDGKFKSITLDKLSEAIDNTTPLVAIKFNTKKSINELIKFLRFYRDNLYKQKEKK